MSDANSAEIQVESLEPPPYLDALRRYAVAAMDAIGVVRWDVSILLCDGERIASLNGEYRGDKHETDVLTFPGLLVPGSDGRIVAGDIVLSIPTIERQAGELGVTFDEELRRTVVHAILHLNGETHANYDLTSDAMLVRQEELLAQIKERIT